MLPLNLEGMMLPNFWINRSQVYYAEVTRACCLCSELTSFWNKALLCLYAYRCLISN